MMKKTAIKLENITKIYPNGLVANNKINFDLKYGEVHAIFGENGAGKTTLVKILLGETTATSGKIYINDHYIRHHNLQISQNFDIAIIHQHFSLIDNFTVFENVILGYEVFHTAQTKKIEKTYLEKLSRLDEWYQTKTPSSFLERRYQSAIQKLGAWKNKKIKNFFCYDSKKKKELNQIIEKFNLNLTVDTTTLKDKIRNFFSFWKGKKTKKTSNLINDLSVSKKQKVEILKVLFKNAKIIIFDEPTSTISTNEIKNFLQSLELYKKAGKAVVFISHKLKEIRQVADHITVLKSGNVMGSFINNEKISDQKLIELMIGDLSSLFSISKIKRNATSQEKLLEISNLNLVKDGKKVLENINLTLKKGEIVGLSGIEDNGQKELLEIIARLTKEKSGKIVYDGKFDLTSKDPFFAKKKGIAYITQDRNKEGLIASESLFFNTFFNNWTEPRFFNKGFINSKNISLSTQKILKKYKITGATFPEQKAEILSGGNQQKFIIGRELETKPKLLLIHEPTWGVDVGTINHLNSLMINLRNQGNTILFASAELEEIIKLSDRILVINKGQIKGELSVHSKDVIKRIGDLITL